MHGSPGLACAALCMPVCTVYFLTPLYLRLQKFEKITVQNYRGVKIPTAGGLLLFAALFSVLPFYYLFLQEGGCMPGWPMFLYWGAITFLGAVDDLQGEKNCKGFRGHLQQFWRGKGVSTGLCKAAGGLVAGVLISAWTGTGTWPEWLGKGIFLALFTNFFNLLDTRPARAAKVFFFFSLVFMLILQDYFLPALSLWGALYIYLFWELEQKIMLGDTGAYLLGGVLGLDLITRLPFKTLLILTGALFILHYLGEKYSWSDFLDNKKMLLHWQLPGKRN